MVVYLSTQKPAKAEEKRKPEVPLPARKCRVYYLKDDQNLWLSRFNFLYCLAEFTSSEPFCEISRQSSRRPLRQRCSFRRSALPRQRQKDRAQLFTSSSALRSDSFRREGFTFSIVIPHVFLFTSVDATSPHRDRVVVPAFPSLLVHLIEVLTLLLAPPRLYEKYPEH